MQTRPDSLLPSHKRVDIYITQGLSDIRTVPRLRGHEVQPPAATFYVDIDLQIDKTVKPCTGIFFPEGYRPSPNVDLIIYLHGYTKDEHGRWYPGLTIDRYWADGSFPHHYFPLREGVNASGKNVVLAAPTLGPKSEAGNLTHGFDGYLDQVMAALITYGPYEKVQRSPTLGNVILACHSGGGNPMLRIAMGRNRYSTNVQEYWGFDCLYSGYEDNIKRPEHKLFTEPNRWIRWATSNKDKRLYIYHKGSTKRESEYLREKSRIWKVSNVFVKESKAQNHFWVPIAHWSDLIHNAQFLSNR